MDARAFRTEPGCVDAEVRASLIDDDDRTSDIDPNLEPVEVDDRKFFMEVDARIAATDPIFGEPVEFEDLISSILASAVYWRVGDSSSSASETVSQTESLSAGSSWPSWMLFGGIGGGRSGCMVP